jgi:hypothetical protein
LSVTASAALAAMAPPSSSAEIVVRSFAVIRFVGIMI